MAKLRYLPSLVLVVGLLVLPATAPGDANVSSISFQGNATLIGLGINVTLHYSCPPTLADGAIQVEVFQGLVDGTNAIPEPATCDGNNHSVIVTVDGAYVPGDAEGLAVLVSQTSSTAQGAAVADQKFAIK
jgi:hypothetical protein